MVSMDYIRREIYENFIKPKVQSGVETFTLRAGDIHVSLGLDSRMPMVCNALSTSKSLEYYNRRLGEDGFKKKIVLINAETPKSGYGANAYYTYKIVDIKGEEDIEVKEISIQTEISGRHFEEIAREVMSKHFGVMLCELKKANWPKAFDLVSPDYQIVGDAKYFSMVRGKRIPPAKFATIAEHVWFLEKINAKRKFLVFGNDVRVPLEWLKRYRKYVKNIEFYFITKERKLIKLWPKESFL